MEATQGTAGDGDEHTREHLVGEGAVGRLAHILGMRPQLGQLRPFHKQAYHQCCHHEQKGNGKHRIEAPDNLVDREHRGHDIIDKDTDNPQQSGTAILLEDCGRTEHKHRAHHQQKEYREHPHDLTGLLTQVFPDNLRTTGTTVTHGEHTREIVVYAACEDTSQHNPQIGYRAELGAHDSTEDGPGTCDVQKLDHKHLPVRKHNVVNTIGHGNSRSFPVVRAKHAVHKTAIQQIA